MGCIQWPYKGRFHVSTLFATIWPVFCFFFLFSFFFFSFSSTTLVGIDLVSFYLFSHNLLLLQLLLFFYFFDDLKCFLIYLTLVCLCSNLISYFSLCFLLLVSFFNFFGVYIILQEYLQYILYLTFNLLANLLVVVVFRLISFFFFFPFSFFLLYEWLAVWVSSFLLLSP